MGMVVNPYWSGSGGLPPGTLLVGAASLTAGNASGGTANFQIGSGFQAVQSGTPAKMYIQGSTAGASSVAHKLCIYNASSATVWSGTLVAVSEEKSSLAQDTLQEYALTTVNEDIVEGQWYGLSIHSAGNFGVRRTSGPDQRFFGDTYADGPAATAGATGQNSTIPTYIYVTT